MGNVVGRRLNKKKAKIMKIDGQTFKLKLPATAEDVLGDYPAGYALLESEAVRRCKIRAPRLRPEEDLKPGKIYFLVDMPRFPQPVTAPERSDSGRTGTARERLEGLMLTKKTMTDVGSGSGSAPVRIRVRLPRAQVAKLMREGKDVAEVAEGILDLCLQDSGRPIATR